MVFRQLICTGEFHDKWTETRKTSFVPSIITAVCFLIYIILSLIIQIFKRKWKIKIGEAKSSVKTNRKIIDLSSFPISLISFFVTILNLVVIAQNSKLHPKDLNISPNKFNIAIIQSICPCLLMISLAFAFIGKSKPLQRAIWAMFRHWPSRA